MSAPGPWAFRQLRRSDLASYLTTVRYGIGKLERSTGLDASAEETIQSLSKWWVSALLGILKLFGRPIVDIYVATDGRQVAGTGLLLWLPRTAYVAGMATRPEFRGQGIASRVLALQQAEASRRHRAWLALDVESENVTARRVYRKAGYRDAAEFTWHTRTGAPPTTGPIRPETRVATTAELNEFGAKFDASSVPDYRGPFPAGARMLSHIELLVRGTGAVRRTWIQRASGGAPFVLRAYFLPGPRLAAYFPLTIPPEPAPEEYRSLFDAASEWLRPRGPRRCIVVTREPVGSVGPTLLRLGFTPAVSSILMVRETSR